MSIAGIGTDVVDVRRFTDTIARRPALVDRLFSEAERESDDSGLAARFAAKEAVAKALGAPPGMRWHDVEVVRGTRSSPHLVVRGAAAEVAASLGIGAWHVSLSHDAGLAVAFVVAAAWCQSDACPEARRPASEYAAAGRNRA